MNAKVIIPIAAGAAIVGGVFVSVPPENRRIEWPILGTLTGVTAIICAMLLYRGGFKPPALTNDIPTGNAKIIPFRRAA
jgi:hypothetical protein